MIDRPFQPLCPICTSIQEPADDPEVMEHAEKTVGEAEINDIDHEGS